MEVWKDIEGYEGCYQVSNLGNVKGLERKVLMKGIFPYIKKESILNPSIQKNGYLAVGLSKNRITETRKIHQLVAVAFLNHKKCGSIIIVDHINNDKKDNRLINLQLISQRENTSKDRKNGSSNFIGVFWNSQAKKWSASIIINKKRIFLGSFKNEIDASNEYQKALNKLNGVDRI